VIGVVVIAYLVSLAIVILIIVAVPAISWARAFKIVGLSFNLAGAFTSLAPRAVRTREQIERELAMVQGRERLRTDTLLARYGIAVFAVGFLQQLIGNLIG
jgi:hypothetical protein